MTREENYIFKKLLSVDDLFDVYIRIGDSLRTVVDVKNLEYDRNSVRNSLMLLASLNLIIDKDNEIVRTRSVAYEIGNFKQELASRLNKEFQEESLAIVANGLHYDDVSSSYYIKQNYIPLSLSGLVMLLDGLGVVRICEDKIFVSDALLTHLDVEKYKEQIPKANITIWDLRDRLAIQDKLGNEAEELALEFEKHLLLEQGIINLPKRVSVLDVAAGYDIASYASEESNSHDKFIEVKSCADSTYKFYISKNEIEVSKHRQERYFLYLFNRQSRQFRIIHNPYDKIFCDNRWAVSPQIFEVHSIVNEY